jgi:hypothetical protein
MSTAVTSARRGSEDEGTPRWAAWFVGLFLSAFVICAVGGIEAWPLTGWRLFSHLRYEHQTSWRAAGVDSSVGGGHPLRDVASRPGPTPPDRRVSCPQRSDVLSGCSTSPPQGCSQPRTRAFPRAGSGDQGDTHREQPGGPRDIEEWDRGSC